VFILGVAINSVGYETEIKNTVVFEPGTSENIGTGTLT